MKVDDLRPVQFREKAFKRLVIRDDYKRIIKAMVEAYRLDKPGFSDIVAGKGRGLTILLHGPPGTGKTLTAGSLYVQTIITLMKTLTSPRVCRREASMPVIHH